ncbi:hypothetical protein ABBQ38_005450 [Trebouxia sp. C0009 RCD-2024]
MSEFHGSGSLESFTLSRPSIGSWRHKKSNLYKETLLDVAQSLKINAVDFNAAADAVAAHQQTEEQRDVLLTADIGGTNCRFSLWQANTKVDVVYDEVFTKTYPTSQYKTFEDAFEALMAEPIYRANPPASAALACAGFVQDNTCDMTNLSWTIAGDDLTEKYGLRVAVLNDFEAAGYGITVISENDYVALNDVPAAPQGPRAVLGPGTGLGEAQLIWDDRFEGYKVYASEGAHSTFAPRGDIQRQLHAFVEQKFGYCEVEHLACGAGLVNIYNFLRTVNPSGRPQSQLQQERDPPSIGMAAMQEGDELCLETVDLMLTILGAEAGHMGIRLLASGGVYLTGGITPKFLDRIQETGDLLKTFMQPESRFHSLLKTLPLYAVTHERLGVLGTREYALRLLKTPDVTKGYYAVVEAARRGDLFKHGTV